MSHIVKSWLRPLVLSGVMLRVRGLVLLTISSIVCQTSTEQIIVSNGWIPMSHTDIYNQIRRESTEHPVYRTMKPLLDYESNLIRKKNNAIKDFRDFKENLQVFDENPFDSVSLVFKTDTNNEPIVKEQTNNIENTRKAKKIWNNIYDIDNNNLKVPEINSKISLIHKDNSIKDEKTVATAETNTYEVTEDTYASVEDTTENIGYIYNPPTYETQNLTSMLYKILSKYNINSEDKLQNYDLSLRNRVQNPSSSAYKVLLPYGYNSLNHLPVDPLLAVFLSNYGFYLPSLYGIKSNYNNLYGYLASNNIHNNKPFGLYKVFSDTDSWN